MNKLKYKENKSSKIRMCQMKAGQIAKIVDNAYKMKDQFVMAVYAGDGTWAYVDLTDGWTFDVNHGENYWVELLNPGEELTIVVDK